MKIVDDYPKLKAQCNECELMYKDLKKLNTDERKDLLKIIGLDVWDFRKVKKRVRWLKLKKWFWLGGGIVVGAAAVALKPK